MLAECCELNNYDAHNNVQTHTKKKHPLSKTRSDAIDNLPDTINNRGRETSDHYQAAGLSHKSYLDYG
jgi:hypothetical protein